MALASSSRSFSLPRIVSSSLLPSATSTRPFSCSSSSSAPYRTSTGQEAVLPLVNLKKYGGKKSEFPEFKFVDYRDRQALPYPFSPTAIVPFLPPLPAVDTVGLRAPAGLNIIRSVNHNLVLTQDPNSHWFLFSSKYNPKNYIRVGSVVQVTSWTTMAKERQVVFTGVMIGSKRRGPASSFDLRNVILRTGVEMRFMCSSPLIKDIKCLKQADSKPGNLKKVRHAKLYYYRDQPDRLLPAIAALKEGRRAKVEAGTAFAS